MNILKSLVDSEYKELQKFKKIADAIDALDPEMKALTDEELSAKTIEFKEQLKNGTSLDNLIVPAFAVARETARIAFAPSFPLFSVPSKAIISSSIAIWSSASRPAKAS